MRSTSCILGFLPLCCVLDHERQCLQAKATHICLDCGYIYTLSKPFDQQASKLIAKFLKHVYIVKNSYHSLTNLLENDLQPDGYACPQCNAPKKRFARYDVNTGKAVGGGLPPIGVIIGLVAGITGIAALLSYGLQ